MAELRDSETRDDDNTHASRTAAKLEIANTELDDRDLTSEKTPLRCRSCSMNV